MFVLTTPPEHIVVCVLPAVVIFSGFILQDSDSDDPHEAGYDQDKSIKASPSSSSPAYQQRAIALTTKSDAKNTFAKDDDPLFYDDEDIRWQEGPPYEPRCPSIRQESQSASFTPVLTATSKGTECKTSIYRIAGFFRGGYISWFSWLFIKPRKLNCGKFHLQPIIYN